MKKGYINELTSDKKMAASTYKAVITYANGEVYEKEIIQYSFSDAFNVIKESHEEENNKEAKTITIDLIR